MKQLDANTYIVADKSSAALLDIKETSSYNKLLHTGNCYKLIKCKKVNEKTLSANANFKPLKGVGIDIKEKKLQSDIEELENSMIKKAEKKTYTNFQDINSMEKN